MAHLRNFSILIKKVSGNQELSTNLKTKFHYQFQGSD